MKNKKQPLSRHQKNVVRHSEKRARERYDIWMPYEIDLIAKDIKKFRDNGNVCLAINKQSLPVMFLYQETRFNRDKFHYLVEHRHKFYWAVWNSSLQTINTFLPLEGLKHRIGFMSNSIVGFLSARGLINLDDYQQFEVRKKKPKEEPKKKEYLTNDAYWDFGLFARNDQTKPHHSIHSQLQLWPDDHLDSLLQMTRVE